MEETIDLRVYVQVLLRHWKWIAALVFVSAIAAFVVSTLQPITYEAQAVIAIVRMRTDFEFTPEIVTLSEDELANRDLDMKARRETFVALTGSSDVAADVLDQVGERLEPEERKVRRLLGMVDASNTGDLIVIQVRHPDPNTAAAIANAWARAAEHHINQLYGAAGGSVDGMVKLVDSAQIDYRQAQAALEAFAGDNPIQDLEREIDARTQVLQAYETALNTAQTESVNLSVSTKQGILEDYRSDLRQIERWLADLRALRAQIETGSSSQAAAAGDALALIHLRSRALGGASNLPVQLQVDLTEGSIEPVQLTDVDALIAVLEARRAETQERVTELMASLVTDLPTELTVESDSPLRARLTAVSQEILSLQQELEAQRARERELSQARDMAWDTYQTLLKKQAEVNIASQSAGIEVRVASAAVLPGRPVSRRALLNTMIAALLALMAAVAAAFSIEFWRRNIEPQGVKRET